MISLSKIVLHLAVLFVCAGQQVQPIHARTKSSPGKVNRAAVRAIRVYCAEVDAFIRRRRQDGRILANVASAGSFPRWQAFTSEKARQAAESPAGDNLNENASVWLKGSKIIGVNFTFQSGARDWAHFVMYYYREDGTLAKVEAMLNTFYGGMSVIRERYYDGRGGLLQESVEYRDLKTNRRRKPGETFVDNEFPTYKTVEELPFKHLISGRAAESNNGMHPTRLNAAFIINEARGRVMPGVRLLPNGIAVTYDRYSNRKALS